MAATFTRRTFIGSVIAAGSLVAAGCGTSDRRDTAAGGGTNAIEPAATPRLAAMTVYRDPSCGCCAAWAQIAREAGYEVTVVDHPDMAAIKRQFGVPDELLSCHTAVVDGYAIEGHVPLEDVKRLLDERPAKLKGIGVAGMPLGSPGMEVPDGTREPFTVMAFDAAGRISTFRAVGGQEAGAAVPPTTSTASKMPSTRSSSQVEGKPVPGAGDPPDPHAGHVMNNSG